MGVWREVSPGPKQLRPDEQQRGAGGKLRLGPGEGKQSQARRSVDKGVLGPVLFSLGGSHCLMLLLAYSPDVLCYCPLLKAAKLNPCLHVSQTGIRFWTLFNYMSSLV